jgi:hypothetical protein
MDSLGIDGGGRYRVLDEGRVIQGLLFMIWSFAAREDPAWAVGEASAALTRWVTLGLPFRREGHERLFDFCEVLNFVKREGLGRRDPAFRDRLVPNGRRLTVESMGEGRPPAGSPEVHDPRRFTVSLRREYNLEGSAPGTPVRLRLPLPYEDATQREIAVEILAPQLPDVEVIRYPGRLDCRLRVPTDPASVAIEVRISLTAMLQTHTLDRDPGRAALLSDDDRELYTRRHEGLIRVTPAVVALAESLRGVDGDPRTGLIAVWAFFFGRMTSGSIHHDELDPADPLGSLIERAWFDCYGGSALLIGLCRALEIPARLVNGIVLHEPSPCFHYWAEVFIAPQGWIPVDLLSWDLSAGTIEEDPWGRLFLGRMDYRMKCECFPRLVVGPLGVRFPPAWYLLPALNGGGTEVSYHALETSRLLYRDLVRIQRHGPGHEAHG